jgi:hypothetical protein
MLIALAAMELLNYLPTRRGPAALLATAGQAMLLSPYLVNGAVSASWRSAGLFCILVAAISTTRRSRSGSGASSSASLKHLERRWFALRDGWGAFWGLRILQRINQSAELSRWPVRLNWSNGLVTGGNTEIDESTVAQVEQTFDSLLRRFERTEGKR